jgi:uncharacterized membrane protein YcaP (DUF421 family)
MDIVLRAGATFVFLFVLLRLIGRRELSTMEPFDVILLVVIGDLAQQGVTQSDYSFTGLSLAVGTFALLTVASSWLVFRFRRVRAVVEAQPLVVVQGGEPVWRNLRAERITVEEVLAEARLQQLGSLDQIEWAILESSGKISFIPRSS